MSGHVFEATARGVRISKIIFASSFILPYLVNYLIEVEFYYLVFYAPWMMGYWDNTVDPFIRPIEITASWQEAEEASEGFEIER